MQCVARPSPISGSPAIQPNVTSVRRAWTTASVAVLQEARQGYVSRHDRQVDRALQLAWVSPSTGGEKVDINRGVGGVDAWRSYGRIDHRVVWNTPTLDFSALAEGLRGTAVEP